ncbi:MAG: hypothetical protein ACK5WT_17340 [Betaproteobacteria bacterium]
MTTPQHRPPLAALAAAVFALSLAACGGGGGEAPPDRPGSVVAPAAPVVTITNNVTTETATGPITFTFSFNRDVGTSFTADDVMVTGGTKGAFTRLSGTGATLVVVPTANASGTVQVSVGAGSVTDATGTGNAAVTAAKAFDTVPPPPPPSGNVVLANFDDVRPTVAGFEGAEGSAIEAGPAGGGSGNSFKVLRSGGQAYALGIVETAVPVTATRRTISAQVYSPLAGIPMVMKIEGPGGASSGDVSANEAVVVGWQTLTWTFSGVDPAQTFNKIVLLPRLGTVDAPPGRAYYFDGITLLQAATGGGGAAALIFSTGFATGNRTVEGGEFGGFSGSNFDGFNCDGNPANCGAGGEFAPALSAADSYFFYYYQTPSPATAMYMGIFVQAPGVVGGFSPSADTPGVQVGSQTTLRFKLGQNAEWFGSATNNFMIVMDLGKRFTAGGGTCRLQLRRVVTPTAQAASSYAIPLSSFALVQDCAGAATSVAQALAASPISQISFQGVGGSNELSDGARTSGANRSVPNGDGRYPTTVVLQGGITID